MRKIIAAINMTIDGICDHTAGLPEDAIHQHYTALLGEADLILYGRIKYQLMKSNLIDEYQLCVHPVVAGSGLPLFKNINERIILNLKKTKIVGGAVLLYYEPTQKEKMIR